ncbi:hypothetical protein MBLNU13_g02410t2 [Cladosporium sp. NU13]
MQRSARDSALPRVEVKFWTADALGEEEIKEFLENDIDGEPKLVDPVAKYQSDRERVEAETLRDTLRKQPLDVREFMGLMARYFRGPWKGGLQTGPIVKVDDPKGRDIMEGDAKLRTNLWSQEERFEMMSANGERPSGKKMGERFDRWEQGKIAEEERKKAEEDERKVEVQRWKEMNNAMDDVQDEIEAEDTTVAMGGFAISQQLPWKGNLADRTRE